MSDVTHILNRIDTGDSTAAEQLLPLLYDELRMLAAAQMAREKPGQTLDATGLVHEAYLRLVGAAEVRQWDSKGHFFAAAAEAMRRILVEAARRKARIRHGGAMNRVDLADVAEPDIHSDDVLALDEALDRLASEEPEVATVVKLRYFAGLTAEQAAEALGISLRTANRHWAYAKAWFFEALAQTKREN
jgi:RNA polymerase sigma factor (TIGR02999 family)